LGQKDDHQEDHERANGEANAQNVELVRLKERIVNLEIELMNYGVKYGLTDRARQLLADQDVV